MTIKARFDGKVLVPDEPLNLQKDQRVELEIRPAPPTSRKYLTLAEFAASRVAGMWEDRDDIKDSSEFVNQLRRRIERREL